MAKVLVLKRSLLAIAITLVVMPLLLVGRQYLIRPPRTAQEQQLFKGIFYRRDVRSFPRPIMLHIVTIDLTAPGIGVLVTPGLPAPEMKTVRGMPAPIPVELQPVSVAKDSADNNGLHPRTVVAVDQSGQKLWLIIVDGRQPYYSEGVTLAELSKILKELGVYTAVNLDGGGSTALVVAARKGSSLLNSPVRNRIPMRERPIANQLGIYAQPMD